MTPDEFITARKALGHTQHAMAEALNMGKHGWQTVSKWERGKQPIPGPIEKLVGLLLTLNPSTEPMT